MKAVEIKKLSIAEQIFSEKMVETAATEMHAAISPGIRENAPHDESILSKPSNAPKPEKAKKSKKKKVKTEI
jgi:hypothetical protein